MKPTRFIIEGEWTGYHDGQRRVVHRQVHPATSTQLRAWAARVGAIRYTDGTCLVVRVRDCAPREKIAEIRGYTKLIDDCARHNVNSVDALPSD